MMQPNRNPTRSNHRRAIPPLAGGLNEINVTPLVDVMLVLLIIFMVTAPMLKQGIDISLPQASERLFPEGTENRFILSIDLNGDVYLDNRKIPVEHLEFKLRSLNESGEIAALFLEADQNLPYAKVIEIMDLIKNSGVKTLGLVTKAKEIKPINEK